MSFVRRFCLILVEVSEIQIKCTTKYCQIFIIFIIDCTLKRMTYCMKNKKYRSQNIK